MAERIGIDIDKKLKEAISEIEPLPLEQCSPFSFWQLLQAIEKEDNNQNKTVGLREYDVICGKGSGKGKFTQAHHGNKQFRRIVQKYREEYQNTRFRDVKKRITNDIIDAVHQLSGRFIKLDDVDNGDLEAAISHSLFEEVTYDYQYQKVSHALRSARDQKESPTRKRSPYRIQTNSVLPVLPPIAPRQLSLDLHSLRVQPKNNDDDDALRQAAALFEPMKVADATTLDEDDLHLLFEL